MPKFLRHVSLTSALAFVVTVHVTVAVTLFLTRRPTPVITNPAGNGCPVGQRPCEVTLSTDRELMLIEVCAPPTSCLEQFSPLSARR